jgi:hypothetical protein
MVGTSEGGYATSNRREDEDRWCGLIRTFYDPNEYAVFDTHAWRELFGEQPRVYSKDQGASWSSSGT